MSCEKHCHECRRERLAEDYFRGIYGDCKSLADFNRAAWKSLDVPGMAVYGGLLIHALWRAFWSKA